jgi:hypothetical protein
MGSWAFWWEVSGEVWTVYSYRSRHNGFVHPRNWWMILYEVIEDIGNVLVKQEGLCCLALRFVCGDMFGDCYN